MGTPLLSVKPGLASPTALALGGALALLFVFLVEVVLATAVGFAVWSVAVAGLLALAARSNTRERLLRREYVFTDARRWGAICAG